MRILLRSLSALPLILLIGCSSLRQKEQFLSAAGFRTVVPSTPAQKAQLGTLPQGRLVPVVKKGQTYFLFADAQNNCLLIGNQKQYRTYQQYAVQYKIQQEKADAAALNADAYEWGGFGGFGDPFFY